MATLNVGMKINGGTAAKASIVSTNGQQTVLTTGVNEYAICDLSIAFGSNLSNAGAAFLLNGDLSLPIWGVVWSSGTSVYDSSKGNISNVPLFSGSIITRPFLFTLSKQLYLPPSSTLVFRADCVGSQTIDGVVAYTKIKNTI